MSIDICVLCIVASLPALVGEGKVEYQWCYHSLSQLTIAQTTVLPSDHLCGSSVLILSSGIMQW
jgi:hypothetical protein